MSYGHPWKRPLPLHPWVPLLWGQSRAVAQHNPWDLPSLSTTSQSPSQQIPGNLLRFLLHPGTLKQKPGDASPKTPGYLPSHFLLGWGFSLAPGTLIIPSTFPRLGIGIPGMQLEHSGSISRKTILAGQPIPGMLLMPLEICCSEGNSSQFLRI